MPTYMVTFTKEVQVSVQCERRKELKAAAKAAAEDGLDGWEEQNWEHRVGSSLEGPPVRPDCGVLNGEIVNYSDYERGKKSGCACTLDSGADGLPCGQPVEEGTRYCRYCGAGHPGRTPRQYP